MRSRFGFEILVSFVFISCGSDYKSYDLKDIQKREVHFNNLPPRVKDFLMNPDQYIDKDSNYLSFVNLESSPRVCVVTEKSNVTPWVFNIYLIDSSSGSRYFIPSGTPAPFILYRGSVVICKNYNVLYCGENISDESFYVYKLK